MKYKEYKITVEGLKITSIVDPLTGDLISNFKAPFTKNGLYKLYVVEQDGEILYVGTTKTSIRTRINYGLNPKGTPGYSGYKWKNRGTVNLHVFIPKDNKKKSTEAIEAEFALLVRLETNQWPTCQNEIHFNNSYKQARLAAIKLFSKIVDRIN